MEEFAVIIPTRGDRPKLLDNCFRQLRRMTLKPDLIHCVDWKPVSNDFDLVERVYDGVCKMKAAGFDLVFIVEDDDYLSSDYFERFGDTTEADFFGDDLTYYYHLKQRAFVSLPHPKRSSLFNTGFRISTLEGFQWGGDVFLDIRLWKWAQQKKLRTRFVNSGAIGIKHSLGLCGGKGHTMRMPHQDPKMEWLGKRVDAESLEFYKSLSNELRNAD